jgi:hypothetical protein
LGETVLFGWPEPDKFHYISVFFNNSYQKLILMPTPTAETLKRTLKPIHLWAIAVGLVISGEYFGWNYGWAVSGTIGF